MRGRSTAQLLKEYVRGILTEVEDQRRLRVFDFDDTLVKTDAKTVVTHADGTSEELTPGAYALYVPREGDVFDYTQFQQLINPRQIRWTGKILNSIYNKYGPRGFVILTARGTSAPAEQFMNDIGLAGVEVIGLGTGNPQAKSSWIQQRIKSDKLNFVEFFDDSPKNAEAVASLNKEPGIESSMRQSTVDGHTVWVCTLHVNHPRRRAKSAQRS